MNDPTFERVARAALVQASVLLSDWVGGRRAGDEWFAEKKANGGIGDSWVFNTRTGVWSHFASGQKGADIISFYAAVHHVSQMAARDEIARQLSMDPNERVNGHVPVLPDAIQEEPERAAEPIPEDAPELLSHPQWGTASAEYRYGNAFRVTRYDLPDGEKQFTVWTWRGGKWVKKGYGSGRPLYRIHELIKHPTAQVLVVEGEKCADTAAPMFPSMAVLTWAGGSQAIKQSDWTPLKGKDIVIWPDADAPGRACAAELGRMLMTDAGRLRIVEPGERTEGWDIADAISEGWTADQLREFMTKEGREVPVGTPAPSQPTKNVPRGTPKPPVRAASSEIHVQIEPLAAGDESSSLVTWNEMRLDCNQGGIPHPTLANASLIVQSYRDFKGKIWWDSFRGQVTHTMTSTIPKPWVDADTRRLTVAIQQQLKLPKFTQALVAEAVHHAAQVNARNPLTMWLDSLVYTGPEGAIEHWLADCAGVELNDYSRAVARNWLVGMVARAYRPGCKMDNMPVLEGVSGLNKTQLLETLGGEYYKSLTIQFGSKDFFQAIQGAWLIEIPDMAGMSRALHTDIISTLSTRIDSYRSSYGRLTEDHPRTCVFAATSEDDDYLMDPRGRRRYWPLRCTDIDLNTIHQQRDQMFAEAVKIYKAGGKWYEMPEGTAEEQEARWTSDPWEDAVISSATHHWARGEIGPKITTELLLTDAVLKPLNQLSHGDKVRVARILRTRGWIQKRNKADRWWVKKAEPTLG